MRGFGRRLFTSVVQSFILNGNEFSERFATVHWVHLCSGWTVAIYFSWMLQQKPTKINVLDPTQQTTVWEGLFIHSSLGNSFKTVVHSFWSGTNSRPGLRSFILICTMFRRDVVHSFMLSHLATPIHSFMMKVTQRDIWFKICSGQVIQGALER